MPAKINARYKELFSSLMKKNMNKEKPKAGMVAVLNAWRNLDRDVKAIELRHYAKQVRRLDSTRTRHNEMVVVGREDNVIRVAFVVAVNWQKPEESFYGLDQRARLRKHKKAKVIALNP